MTDHHNHPGALDETIAGRPGRGPAPGQPGATQTADPRIPHPDNTNTTAAVPTRAAGGRGRHL